MKSENIAGSFVMPSAGAVLDGYKLLAEVGFGSCGRVFRAENLLSGEIFALKLFPGQGDLAERELHAIRLYQKISHPNLIRILHAGQAGDVFFYTMDRCECSLAQREVSAEELLLIAKKLASALKTLHEHGLLHRDIKPDNIFFRNGDIVLGDIGLVARQEHATFAGSPGFLAPELQNGTGKPSPYTDCYALAKTIYCVLSGEPPEKFPYYTGTVGGTASLLMRAVLAVCSDEARIRTAEDFLRFLDEPETALRPKKNRSRIWLPVAALILLLTASGFFFLFRPAERPGENPPEVPPVPEKNTEVRPSPVKPVSLHEIQLFTEEKERLEKAAARCTDMEERFKCERMICMIDLLIPLLIRRSEMTPGEFSAEQKKLVEISNFADRLQTAGAEAEGSYFPADQKSRLKIADAGLNRRWQQANDEWRTLKKTCALEILREIGQTGKAPEELLREKAEGNAVLKFFGIDQLEFLRQYRNAEPGDAKEEVLKKYMECRNRFLQGN